MEVLGFFLRTGCVIFCVKKLHDFFVEKLQGFFVERLRDTDHY